MEKSEIENKAKNILGTKIKYFEMLLGSSATDDTLRTAEKLIIYSIIIILIFQLGVFPNGIRIAVFEFDLIQKVKLSWCLLLADVYYLIKYTICVASDIIVMFFKLNNIREESDIENYFKDIEKNKELDGFQVYLMESRLRKEESQKLSKRITKASLIIRTNRLIVEIVVPFCISIYALTLLISVILKA